MFTFLLVAQLHYNNISNSVKRIHKEVERVSSEISSLNSLRNLPSTDENNALQYELIPSMAPQGIKIISPQQNQTSLLEVQFGYTFSPQDIITVQLGPYVMKTSVKDLPKRGLNIIRAIPTGAPDDTMHIRTPFEIVNGKLNLNWTLVDYGRNKILKLINNKCYIRHDSTERTRFKLANFPDRLEVRDKDDNIIYSLLITPSKRIIFQGYLVNYFETKVLAFGPHDVIRSPTRLPEQQFKDSLKKAGIAPIVDFEKGVPEREMMVLPKGTPAEQF